MNNISIIHNLDVFISYSSKNEKIANEIEKALLYRNIKCWKANSQSISGGEDFRENIATAISNTKIVLIILSEDSLQSNWVKAELTDALIKNKKIYTIRISEAELDELTEFKLGCSQITDLNNDVESAIESIAINITNERNEIFVQEEERIKKENRNIRLFNVSKFVDIMSIIYYVVMTITYFGFSADAFFKFSDNIIIQWIIKIALYFAKVIVFSIVIGIIKLIYNSIIKNYATLECGDAEYFLYTKSYFKKEKDLKLLRSAAHHGSMKALKELIKLYRIGKYVEKDNEIALEYEEKLTKLKQEKRKLTFNQFIYNFWLTLFFVFFIFYFLVSTIYF